METENPTAEMAAQTMISSVFTGHEDKPGEAPPHSAGQANHSGRDKARIVIARSVQQVEALRSVWNTWQWGPNADIDFYLHVLRSQPEILRPHVLVLYRQESPVALLAGRLVQGAVDVQVGYKKLFSVPARTLTFIYGGQAGDLSGENSAAMISEVMRSLRAKEAELASFRFVRTDSPLYPCLVRCPGFFARDHFPQKQAHWSMLLPRRAEEIYPRLSGEHRSELRRKAKKILQEFGGRVKVRCFRQRDELDQMFRDIEEVACRTYHRALGFGFADSPQTRERMRLEAEKGWLRAYVLYLGDKPGAFWLGSVCHGKFYSDALGYDDAHARHSPGMYLLTRMFEDFCSEGIEEVDFGLGDARYKQRFGNSSWEEACVDIYAPTLAGLRISALRLPGIFIERVVKRPLEKTQILARVKKLWRDNARKAAH